MTISTRIIAYTFLNLRTIIEGAYTMFEHKTVLLDETVDGLNIKARWDICRLYT